MTVAGSIDPLFSIVGFTNLRQPAPWMATKNTKSKNKIIKHNTNQKKNQVLESLIVYQNKKE